MKKLISIISLSFCVSAFADNSGTCSVSQNADGTFRIVCEGDGVIYDYETITNRVTYRVANCEDLRSDLTGLYSDLDTFQNDLKADVYTLRYDADQLSQSIDRLDTSDDGYDYVLSSFMTLDYQILSLESTVNYNQVNLQSLSNTIDSIACCSDSVSNLTQQCCQTDLTPIIERLNKIIQYDIYITNRFDYIVNEFGGFLASSGNFYYANYSQNQFKFTRQSLNFLQSFSPSRSQYYNLANINSQILKNNSTGFTSLNNYFYKFLFEDFALANTNLSVLTLQTTNFFSFFRGEVGVSGVLEDWNSDYGNYYDYLTNHYLKIMFNPADLSESEQQKTNWFSRIETLLAALVFADSEGTNTVDDAQYKDDRESLTSSLSGINSASKTRLQKFENHSDSLLSSVRRFSSAFSDASLPSRVNLVSVGSSDSEMVYFETSEISPFLEACHCATTLIWCFSGLILLFWFIHYTVKASYNLVVFAWSVVSAVFGK